MRIAYTKPLEIASLTFLLLPFYPLTTNRLSRKLLFKELFLEKFYYNRIINIIL